MSEEKSKKTRELGAAEWDLSDLYNGHDDPQIAADLQKCVEWAKSFETRYKDNLKNASNAEILAALIDLEETLQLAAKAKAYGELLVSLDTSNEKFKALEELTTTKITEMQNYLLFFDIELLDLEDEAFDNLLESPRLAEYRHYLTVLKKQKPFRLSLPEERILNEKKQTSFDALYNIFQNFLARMEFKVKIGRRIKILQEQEVLHFINNKDRTLRKEATDALTNGLKTYGWLFTDLINALVKDSATEDKLRRYHYPEEKRHLDNEISKEAVDALTKACADNYQITEKYYGLKKLVLGLPEMFDYDRYAPFGEKDKKVTYGEAKKIVLAAYHSFSPRLASLVEEFYTKRWIDAKVRKGKRGGAFCYPPAPNLHPYILTNFQGSLRDVATEAHELGHGVHGMLSRSQHYLDYNTPLTIAETASVFGEMLVFEYLKKKATSDRDKLFLIMRKIEDIIATVFRQVGMYRFEQRLHQTFRNSGRVSEETLSSWWNEEHQAIFGKSLTLRPEHGYWWMYVSHIFHYPFYVYAYAFGELLTLSLYSRYKNGEKNFEEKYIKFLSAGGSRSPDELLADFGINPSDPEFWEGGIQVMASLLKEAEDLAQNLGY